MVSKVARDEGGSEGGVVSSAVRGKGGPEDGVVSSAVRDEGGTEDGVAIGVGGKERGLLFLLSKLFGNEENRC